MVPAEEAVGRAEADPDPAEGVPGPPPAETVETGGKADTADPPDATAAELAAEMMLSWRFLPGAVPAAVPLVLALALALAALTAPPEAEEADTAIGALALDALPPPPPPPEVLLGRHPRDWAKRLKGVCQVVAVGPMGDTEAPPDWMICKNVSTDVSRRTHFNVNREARGEE